jgi:hypothetical protein
LVSEVNLIVCAPDHSPGALVCSAGDTGLTDIRHAELRKKKVSQG